MSWIINPQGGSILRARELRKGSLLLTCQNAEHLANA